jgi:hypothetical protein
VCLDFFEKCRYYLNFSFVFCAVKKKKKEKKEREKNSLVEEWIRSVAIGPGRIAIDSQR